MSFNILEKYLVTVSPSSFSVLICIRGPWPIITSLLPNLLTLKRPAHAFSGSYMRYRIKGRGIKRQPMIKMHEMQLPYKHLSLSLCIQLLFYCHPLWASSTQLLKLYHTFTLLRAPHTIFWFFIMTFLAQSVFDLCPLIHSLCHNFV